MTRATHHRRTPIILAVALALAGWHGAGMAQDADAAPDTDAGPVAPPTLELPVEPTSGAIDEVVVLGRSLSTAEALITERMDDAVVLDILGADAISRLGDSTVAAALRRLPGLTLVEDKFVYIRGLGERY